MQVGLPIILVIFIALHRPGGGDNLVFVNPSHIVSVTPPRDHGHHSASARCLVHMDSGRLQVIETCSQVMNELKD